MQNFIVIVKRDLINEHLDENEYNSLDFLENIDSRINFKDTLRNYFLQTNKLVIIPIHLSVLQFLKDLSDKKCLYNLEIPLYEYIDGYSKGLETDITPSIESPKYWNEKFNKILSKNLKNTLITNVVLQEDDGSILQSKYSYNKNKWFEYGIHIGIEKQVWDIILRDPVLIGDFIDRNRVFETNQIKGKALDNNVHKSGIKFKSKPIFNPEKISDIYHVLKDFFDPEQQPLLEGILKNGVDVDEHLLFLGNGNRLADSFRILIKANIITGCLQQELENWIFRNFKYKNGYEIKSFTLRYLNDVISTNKGLCKNPIMLVTHDKQFGVIHIRKA